MRQLVELCILFFTSSLLSFLAGRYKTFKMSLPWSVLLSIQGIFEKQQFFGHRAIQIYFYNSGGYNFNDKVVYNIIHNITNIWTEGNKV